MDFAITEMFSRRDPANTAGVRVADDTTESFADVLDAKLRPEQPERPDRPERPERAAATSERPDRPERPARPEKAEEAPTSTPRASDKADKPSQIDRQADKSSETRASDASTETAAAVSDESVAQGEPLSKGNGTLVQELLGALLPGQMPASDAPPAGLIIAAALVPTVVPQQAAAPSILALLTETPAPMAAPTSAPDLALSPVPSPAGAAPTPGSTSSSAPQFVAPQATPAAANGATSDGATPTANTPIPATPAPAAAVTPTATATATAPVQAPAPTSPEAAAVAAMAAAPVVETMTGDQDAETPVPAAPILSEGETLENSPLPIGPAPTAVTPRPATAAPAATAGYATQLASQDPTVAPVEPVEPNANEPKAATQAMPADAAPVADMPQELGDDLAALKPADSTFTAAALAETNRASSSTIENVAQRAGRTAALPVAEQVAVKITKALADGVDRINVKLNPVELGRIEVRMEIGPDGKFNAVFAADRPQTVELLQRDARELARSLQDAGLRADTGSLSFNLRGQNQQQQNNAAHLAALNDTRSGATPNGEALPEVTPRATGYAASGLGAGRVDIRV